MTRYNFLYLISEILTNKYSNELFNYIIHTNNDDGIFLRARYKRSEKMLPDLLDFHML